MDNRASFLEIKNLTVEYTSAGNVIHAVNNVSFCLDKGKTLGLVERPGQERRRLLRAFFGFFQIGLQRSVTEKSSLKATIS